MRKKILIVITGSIAAYKALYLIRKLKEKDFFINVIMTNSAKKFITPLSVSSLSEKRVYENLFDLTEETEMGHIKLAKMHDLIIVMPASANFMAKVSNGYADDLATTVLLASKTKVLFVPAMNINMLTNPITQKNIKYLQSLGYDFIFGNEGKLACGDYGLGRMSEPDDIVKYLDILFDKTKPLDGIEALVTAGPTQEPIDPVRFISNKSSGIQGYLIAEELVKNGANVSLISGPTNLSTPSNLSNFIKVETAEEMLKVCLKKIPKDLFISVAAVTDWKINYNKHKMKKEEGTPKLKLIDNPDILKSISFHKKRPRLVVGFAAETKHLRQNAMKKIKQKKCDFIIANNVANSKEVFGSNMNEVAIMNTKGIFLKLTKMDKKKLAKKIVKEVIVPSLN